MTKAKPAQSLRGRLGNRGKLIGWNDIERRVRSLSRHGDEGIRIPRSPEETLAEAQRLAEYYRKAGKPLPDTLAALV